ERAVVCLTSPSAGMISYFTSRVCRGHSKERPKVPASLRHPEVLLSFSPIRAGRKGWMAPFGTLFPWPQPHAGVGADRFLHGNTSRKQETAPLASPTTNVIPSAPTLTSRDRGVLSSSRVARHDPLFRPHTFTVPSNEPVTTRPSPV